MHNVMQIQVKSFEHQNGEKRDLSDFDRSVVGGTRRAGLRISELLKSWIFMDNTHNRVYT